MSKFKVTYQETRWYSKVVEADNKQDAIEVADSLMKCASDWNYRNEEYDVKKVSKNAKQL